MKVKDINIQHKAVYLVNIDDLKEVLYIVANPAVIQNVLTKTYGDLEVVKTIEADYGDWDIGENGLEIYVKLV